MWFNFTVNFIFHYSFQAMQLVSDGRAREAIQKQEMEKELSKVKINKEDVDLIVSIFC